MRELSLHSFCYGFRKTESFTFVKQVTVLPQGDNPGAAKYGNFINYYSFHSSKDRIENLNSLMFPSNLNQETIYCLDVGCNTGELTVALKSYMKSLYPNSKIKMLAIDIDSNLIKRANDSNSDEDILFVTGDVLTELGLGVIRQYLNTYFKNTFDVIFCFSVSMWIHINNGDEGLIQFLKFLTNKTKVLIIEPQPWKCYKNAQRRLKRSGSNFYFLDDLKIRDTVDLFIEKTITENNHTKVYESSMSTWNRKVLSFVSIQQ